MEKQKLLVKGQIVAYPSNSFFQGSMTYGVIVDHEDDIYIIENVNGLQYRKHRLEINEANATDFYNDIRSSILFTDKHSPDIILTTEGN